MPTIIDSLIVKLGLDKKDYDVGSEKVKKSLKETGVEAEKAGTGIKKHIGKEGSASFDSIAKSAVKFLAVIGGTYAVKQFIEQTVESSAALDRLSKNLGESAQSLSAWSQASEIAGGTASGLQGTMAMLSRAQTELALTGETSLRPYFNFLRVAMADSAGGARPVSEILLDLAERFSHMDRVRAFNVGQMMGIDPGTMNLLLEGRKSVEAMIGRQKEYSAVTKQQAEESSRLRAKMVEIRQSFEAFGRQLLSDALPALEWLLNKFEAFGKWCHENKDFVETFLTILAIGLSALAIAALPLTGTIALIMAVAAAIALLYDDYQVWKKGGESLIDWEKWEPQLKEAKKGIKDFARDSMIEFKNLAQVASLTWKELILLGEAGKLLASGDFAGAWAKMKEANDIDAEAWGIIKNYAHEDGKPESKPGTEQSESWFKRNFGHLKDNYEENYRKRNGTESGGDVSGIHIPHGKSSVGTIAWRHNNPGNLMYAGQKGATQGEAKKGGGYWARFATPEEGFAAHVRQIELDQRRGYTLAGLINKYGPPTENDTAWYTGTMAKQLGVNPNTPASQISAVELAKRMEAIESGTGFSGIPGASKAASGAGAAVSAQSKAPAVGPQSSNSVQTHIGEINVHTQATDADGIAKDMGKSMDYLFTSQANYGLV